MGMDEIFQSPWDKKTYDIGGTLILTVKQQKSTPATGPLHIVVQGIPCAAICSSLPSQCNLLEGYEAGHKN